MLKVLVKKQLMEIFRSYFYNAKKNKAYSKSATAAYVVLFVMLMVGVLGGIFTGMALMICKPMAEAEQAVSRWENGDTVPNTDTLKLLSKEFDVCKLWDAGEKGLTLSAFEWEKDRKTLIYGQVDYMYGKALYKPEMKEGNPIRLYSLDEITEIFCKLGLRICNSFADFSGKPSSDNDIQLMVYSIRE